MSHQEHIRKLIVNHSRRLQILKEQQALHGRDTKPEILLEIEDVETEIKLLKVKLEKFPTDASSAAQAKILVVDDNADWQETITELLKQEGHFVRSVHNGKAAFEAIIQENFDFVFVDVNLYEGISDDESGLVLAFAIKQINPQTFVAAITGYANTDLTVRALKNYNVDYFINKEDIPDQLLKIITRHLGKIT